MKELRASVGVSAFLIATPRQDTAPTIGSTLFGVGRGQMLVHAFRRKQVAVVGDLTGAALVAPGLRPAASKR